MPQTFDLLRPGPAGPDPRRGLYCLVGGPEQTPAEPRPRAVEEHVANFEAYAAANAIDLRRQVMAMRNNCVRGMALWVPSAGKTAMVFTPNLSEHPAAAEATVAALDAALADARRAGVQLIQVMLDVADAFGADTLSGAGLLRLATLVYMERTPPIVPPAISLLLGPREELSPGLRLEPYSPTMHAAFAEAIRRSYEQTLDCPALSGMRAIDDVIAGHMAVGRFDPQLWSVVMEGPKPLGCLLLADIPARGALDVVYLGLAPEARGRGIARALMKRALAIGSRRAFSVVSLAVDATNEPALRLYKRFGFGDVGRRVAMVKRL